jgi:hypothetical protein
MGRNGVVSAIVPQEEFESYIAFVAPAHDIEGSSAVARMFAGVDSYRNACAFVRSQRAQMELEWA